MSLGLAARKSFSLRSRRSIVPGRKFSISTSARSARRRRSATPSVDLRSMVTLFVPIDAKKIRALSGEWRTPTARIVADQAVRL